MKHLFILCITAILLFSCSNFIMLNEYNFNFKKYQVDSILKVENIDYKLNNWDSLILIDYENKDTLIQYAYLVKLKNNKDVKEILFSVSKFKSDSMFIVKKRIIKNNKK